MRHLCRGSRRLTAGGRATLACILLLVAVGCWWLGGGALAAERSLMVAGGRIGPLAPAPLLLLTRVGNLPILGPLALALALLLGRRLGAGAGLAWFGGLALFRVLVDLVKIAVARPRPALVPHLDPLASGLSFPSAHSADSMAVFLAFALAWGGTAAPVAAVLLAGAIGVSRVLLGVHWPSDVLAGWSLGAAWALGSGALTRRLATRRR